MPPSSLCGFSDASLVFFSAVDGNKRTEDDDDDDDMFFAEIICSHLVTLILNSGSL